MDYKDDIPINKLELLIPYIGVALIILITATAIVIKVLIILLYSGA